MSRINSDSYASISTPSEFYRWKSNVKSQTGGGDNDNLINELLGNPSANTASPSSSDAERVNREIKVLMEEKKRNGSQSGGKRSRSRRTSKGKKTSRTKTKKTSRGRKTSRAKKSRGRKTSRAKKTSRGRKSSKGKGTHKSGSKGSRRTSKTKKGSRGSKKGSKTSRGSRKTTGRRSRSRKMSGGAAEHLQPFRKLKEEIIERMIKIMGSKEALKEKYGNYYIKFSKAAKAAKILSEGDDATKSLAIVKEMTDHEVEKLVNESLGMHSELARAKGRKSRGRSRSKKGSKKRKSRSKSRG